MVSTRSSSSRAGSAAPETPAAAAVPATPSRASKRTTAGRKSLSANKSSSSSPPPPPPPRSSTLSSSSSSSSSSSNTSPSAHHTTTGWSHAPDAPTLFWLGVSLPLVIWDTVYVLGRPHTMEHGWLHWPLWAPYKLYGEVDHVYGWKAYHARSGFTSAQGALNAVETAMYLAYAWAFFTKAVDVGVNGNGNGSRRAIAGRVGAQAVLIGFSAAVMTLAKTLLYWLNEYFSGFDNIGHNDLLSLIFLWIIPNGAWLVGSTWMIYSLGGDILRAIETASHVKNE